MRNRLVVRPSRCTGCRTCEVACAFSHLQEMKPGVTRVVVCRQSETRFIPMLCLQCDNAACVKVCPVKALSMDPETGVVLTDYGRCIRCRACVAACPFGNMRFEAPADRVIKCDLCKGSPMCAAFCPTGTIKYEGI